MYELDRNADDFEEIRPPTLVKTETMISTGHLPKFVDEAYHHFVEDARYATSVPHVLAGRPVIIARTFSKIYGMAGMRVGYAVGSRANIEAMRRYAESQPPEARGWLATEGEAGRGELVAEDESGVIGSGSSSRRTTSSPRSTPRRTSSSPAAWRS